MDNYRISDRRKRYLSPPSLGYSIKQGQNRFGSNGTQVAEKYRHSPYISKSQTQVKKVVQPVRIHEDYMGCFALESTFPAALRSINESKMSTIARRALKRNNFRIQGWRVRKLESDDLNPVNLGLYRFEGIGVDRNEWLDWSLILKVIQSPANQGYTNMGEGDDPAHWNYWKRELLLYQSGWLETLPEGISSPRCFDAEELPGDIAGLWLEDINDSFSGTWPLYRYALTARHLGRLNGTFVGRRELPTYPWLCTNRTQQWLKSICWQDFPWDSPRVMKHFPQGGNNSFRRMLDDHGTFLSKLDQLPQTISHGDTYPSNFRSRRMVRGQEQTVAMDWALAGIAPLGDDLGQLVYGTSMNLKGYKLQDISQMLFTSYINGLQDSNCRIDTDLVRFGYVASAALRVGLFKLSLLVEELENEDNTTHHTITYPSMNEPFESVMANEAYRLLDKI